MSIQNNTKEQDITRLDIINCSHKNSVKLIKTLNNTITDRDRMFRNIWIYNDSKFKCCY